MDIYYGIVYLLLGLCIGSFLNVVIYRVPKEESIVKGRSACTKCGKQLGFFDLIPVLSFVFLRGKCRYCKEKISARYCIVELITGLVFLGIFIKYGLSAELFFFSFLMSILIAVLFIDIEHMIIPDGLVITGLIGGVVLIFYNAFFSFDYFGQFDAWWMPFIGMLVGPVALLILAIIGSLLYGGAEVIGGGDIKIYAPIGIFLGWGMAGVSLFFSFIIGGFIGALLLLFRRKKRDAHIPFGPFIVIATYVTILYGKDIVLWYFTF